MNRFENLSPKILIEFLQCDFETAWNKIAEVPKSQTDGRGNFMFVKMAVMLLEMACRICKEDQSGDSLRNFSKALYEREPRYFLKVPEIESYKEPKGFDLPTHPEGEKCNLLSLIFDLVRNGQAHQYQQIVVTLSDGKGFGFSVTGPEEGLTLGELTKNPKTGHLSLMKDQEPDVWVKVHTHRLYLDVKSAIETSTLKSGKLTHLNRKYDGIYAETLRSALT